MALGMSLWIRQIQCLSCRVYNSVEKKEPERWWQPHWATCLYRKGSAGFGVHGQSSQASTVRTETAGWRKLVQQTACRAAAAQGPIRHSEGHKAVRSLPGKKAEDLFFRSLQSGKPWHPSHRNHGDQFMGGSVCCCFLISPPSLPPFLLSVPPSFSSPSFSSFLPSLRSFIFFFFCSKHHPNPFPPVRNHPSGLSASAQNCLATRHPAEDSEVGKQRDWTFVT